MQLLHPYRFALNTALPTPTRLADIAMKSLGNLKTERGSVSTSDRPPETRPSAGGRHPDAQVNADFQVDQLMEG